MYLVIHDDEIQQVLVECLLVKFILSSNLQSGSLGGSLRLQQCFPTMPAG